MQYLLDLDPYTGKSDDGNPLPKTDFDPKKAVRMCRDFLRESENLLKANLVHFSLFSTVIIFFLFVNCIFVFVYHVSVLFG